ncbi:MAG: energy transducer TonB [Hyphomonas sp.]
MTTRPFILSALLVPGGCASAPEPAPAVIAPPGFCKAAHEAGPSYSQTDLEARIAERKAALPEDAAIADLTAIARPAPEFPLCATFSDQEGQCVMVFDVLPDGTTANILPVCNSRLFERDAVAAVRRWIFEPPGNGPRPAVLNLIVFKLPDTAAPTPLAPQAARPEPVNE